MVDRYSIEHFGFVFEYLLRLVATLLLQGKNERDQIPQSHQIALVVSYFRRRIEDIPSSFLFHAQLLFFVSCLLYFMLFFVTNFICM